VEIKFGSKNLKPKRINDIIIISAKITPREMGSTDLKPPDKTEFMIEKKTGPRAKLIKKPIGNPIKISRNSSKTII